MKKILLFLTLCFSAFAADPKVNGVAVLPRSAVSDVAYDASTWNGDTNPPTKNALRDKIELIITGGGLGTGDIDTSAEIASIVTDEVGSTGGGKLTFNKDTPFTGTTTVETLTASGTVSVGTGSAGSVAIGDGGTHSFTIAPVTMSGNIVRVPKTSASTGLLKVTASGTTETEGNAVSGTDFAPATSGSAILKGNGAGGFSSAVSSTDYAPATSGSGVLKGNGSGGFSAATVGTDILDSTYINDTAYDATSWNGVTTVAPSKNAVRDYLQALPASAITSGVFPIARLATGTPNGSQFVRDDGTLATPAGGSGGLGTNTLTSSTTAAVNLGAGEDDLISYTIPASTMAVNGDTIAFWAGMKLTNSLNNKRIRVRFGSTVIFDSGALAITAATDVGITARIIRAGATTQKAIVEMNSSSATLMAYAQTSAPTETLSGTIVLKITGEAVADNDITFDSWQVSLNPGTALGTGWYAPGGTDVTVPDGGTGVSSLTAYAPVFGGTTSTAPVQSGTVGTSGQVLTSNGAGALPTFQAASGGSSVLLDGSVHTDTLAGSVTRGDIIYGNSTPKWARKAKGNRFQALGWDDSDAVVTSDMTFGSRAYFIPVTIIAPGTGSTFNVSGDSGSITGTGSTVAPTSTDPAYLDIVNSGGANTECGVQGNLRFHFARRIRMHAYVSITSTNDCRFWFGVNSATGTTMSASDDPVSHIAAFRYSSVAGDVNWMACTKDGSTAIGATDTTIAMTTGVFLLTFDFTPSTNCKFYINRTLVATRTTNLPGSSTGRFQFYGRTIGAASKSVRVSAAFFEDTIP